VQTANTIRSKTNGARSATMEVHKGVSKAKEGERNELKVREVKKEKKPKNDNKTWGVRSVKQDAAQRKRKYTSGHT